MEDDEHEERALAIEMPATDSTMTGPSTSGEITKTAKNYYFPTFHLSLCAFLMYTSWAGLESVLITLFGAAGVCTVSFSYMAYALGSIFPAPLVVSRLGVHNSLILGVFSFAIFPLSVMEPSGALMVLCGTFAGLGSSIFFIAQPVFLTASSTPETVGTHNGIFYTFLLLTFFVGNVLSTFLLTNYSVLYLVLCLTAFAFLGTTLTLFLPTSKRKQKETTTSEDEPAHAMQTLQSVRDLVQSSVRLQLYSVPFAWQGFALAVSTTWYPTNILAPCYGVNAIGMYMSTYGIVNAMGALLSGIVMDKIGRKTTWVCGVMLTSVMAIGGCALSKNACSVVGHQLIAALLGLSDACTNVVLGSVLIVHFSETPMQLVYASGWYHLVLGVTAFLFMQVCYHFSNLFVEAVAVLGSLTVSFALFAAEKQQGRTSLP